jgi:hypothetical protein
LGAKTLRIDPRVPFIDSFHHGGIEISKRGAAQMLRMIAAIRAIMRAVSRAMSAMVRVTVRVGDRLISMLVPAPMPPVDTLEPDTSPDPSRDTGSEFMAIRNLAYARMTGRMPTPAELAAAGKLGSEWISVMPKPMLKAVLLADDGRLHRHMRGIECIKGVLRYDETVIDEYRIALLRERARVEEAKRTMTPLRYA